MAYFHPDLAAARFIPSISFGPRLAALARRGTPRVAQAPDDIIVEDLRVPGPEGAPEVELRSYRPRGAAAVTPALLWIHGGGMIIGNHLSDQPGNIGFARELGITVFSVKYRLAPDNPALAAIEDVYAAFRWLSAHAAELGIDPARIAIGGASAGGGLAAGTTLLAHDSDGPVPIFQLLVYPMLDDRTVNRTDHHVKGVRLWTKRSNRYAWSAYLGKAAGGSSVSDYAAPARRSNLVDLPPAWIGVGTNDLFHDEDVRYAERLRAAGVSCELMVVDGAFHGFDIVMANKNIARTFWRAQVAALSNAFDARSNENE